MPRGISKNPESTKAQRSAFMKANNPMHKPEIRKKLSVAMMGKSAGPKNHKWKGGISGIYKLKNHPDYKYAIENRNEICPICLCKESDQKRKFAFDHDHKTNKFRGWLCSNCNRALGLFKDDPKVLERAVKYLTYAQQEIPEQ